MKLLPLDILFSEFIRRRAIQRVNGCERCLQGKTDYKQLQCSHFVGRSRRAVRWDEDNATGLCPGCHMYLTAHPTEHVRWFTEHLGDGKINLLVARSYHGIKPDTEAIKLYLKTKIKELENL